MLLLKNVLYLFWINRYLVILLAFSEYLEHIALPKYFTRKRKDEQDIKDSVSKRVVAKASLVFILMIIVQSIFNIVDWETTSVAALNEMESKEESKDENTEEYPKVPAYDRVESYILQSQYKIISNDMWHTFSKRELYYIRNGIFAYCGRKFLEPELTQYYSRYDWYDGVIEPQDFMFEYLNEYQQQNAITIRDIEATLPD